MKQTRLIMGMPVAVEVIDKNVNLKDIDEVFNYFKYVDNKFSTFKEDSEISKIERGEVKKTDYSADVKEIFNLADKTKRETDGYFNIWHNNKPDPSGIVKGWAIYNASKILKKLGYKNFYVEAGGDIQTFGENSKGKKWKVGIKNPFNLREIVKVVKLRNKGIATSGTYLRGQHIYNPYRSGKIKEIVSITVIADNICEADRFATAAFAMGARGINFIEKCKGLEGYMIGKEGIATYTSGFKNYL
ncbi:FAD:protein FMN transferase [Candidatus Woesebacteria bacterium]|nr:FAD:protein FMN transferase [Candidatus Woesebacteria bacterium]